MTELAPFESPAAIGLVPRSPSRHAGVVRSGVLAVVAVVAALAGCNPDRGKPGPLKLSGPLDPTQLETESLGTLAQVRAGLATICEGLDQSLENVADEARSTSKYAKKGPTFSATCGRQMLRDVGVNIDIGFKSTTFPADLDSAYVFVLEVRVKTPCLLVYGIFAQVLGLVFPTDDVMRIIAMLPAWSGHYLSLDWEQYAFTRSDEPPGCNLTVGVAQSGHPKRPAAKAATPDAGGR